MIEKLTQTEYLTRTEVADCIDSLFYESDTIKHVKALQDYSGNYDEIYNEYYALNIKATEQMLADFFLDCVLLEEQKKVEYIYYVEQPVSTYLKFESQRVNVYNQLGYKTYATPVKPANDFIIFNDSALLVLDYTKEGALKGGFLTTKKSDVQIGIEEYNRVKAEAVDFLKVVPCESSIKNAVNRKIKELKYKLKIK